MGMFGYYCRLDDIALAACRKNPDLIPKTEENSLNKELVDVEKTWEALAYLLSKRLRDWTNGEEDAADPHADPDVMLTAIKGSGGEVISIRDEVYLLLTPAKVCEIAAALEPIDLAQLRENYDPELMDDAMVYPEIWTRDGNKALEQYVYPYFLILKSFFSKAASQNQYVITYRV